MAAAIPPLVSAAVTSQARDDITKFAANMTSEWSGSMFALLKIKLSVHSRKVLGASSALKRKPYAMSPILYHITNYCLRLNSTVFVVHASAGMGKTSACHAVLDKYAKKGFAISPGDLTGSYKGIILKRLGLNPDKPPEGWLRKLVDELQTPWRELPGVLLLDDFMNEDASNEWDKQLLLSLKSEIRSRNITVIILTKNERAANKMITMNDMVAIVPAEHKTEVQIIRTKYNKFQAEANEGGEFEIDWYARGRLKWETSELKNAIAVDPSYKDMTEADKAVVMGNIDLIIQNMDEGERDQLIPQTLIQLLNEMESVPELASPRGGWPTSWHCGF